MSPTNLGALATSSPAPSPMVQIKRGAVDASVVVNNTVAYGTKLTDGAGGFMQISVTPAYNCWWVVRGNVMAHGVDAIWSRWDWSIRLSPADADGTVIGFQRCMQVYANSTVEWRSAACSYCFRLNANTTYTAALTHEYSPGYSQRYHCGPSWCRIIGRLTSEGVL